MSVTVRIPTPLRKITNDQDRAIVSGNTLDEIIASLNASFPGIKDRICDETGELRSFVNVYINGEDVRFLDGLNSPTAPGDEVSIVPAVAGGVN